MIRDKDTVVHTMSMKTSSKPKRRSSRRKRGATREALIDAAFELLADNKSFDGLSLRELTRSVGIVPTAFYRHFPRMEDFGLALVAEAFAAFRQVIAQLQAEPEPGTQMIRNLTRSMIKSVQTHQLQFRFIASERYGGDAGVRTAIRQELRLIETEVALELGRMPVAAGWSSDDLRVLACLFINTLVAMGEEVIDQAADDPKRAKALMDMAEKQMRLIALGVKAWDSKQQAT